MAVKRHRLCKVVMLCVLALLTLSDGVCAETKKDKKNKIPVQQEDHSQRFKVVGGKMVTDSVAKMMSDKATADTTTQTKTATAPGDTLSKEKVSDKVKDAKLLEPRYSAIFRDTMPLSRMTALSFVIPGFSQLHNKQYWKIPVLYATVGALAYGSVRYSKDYSRYKTQYDALIKRNASREELNPVQSKMIEYNTARTLFIVGTLASYIYFIGDGAVNYPGTTSRIKKATTLSTIFPGAGQLYNQSFWKVPIVIGAFATMGYVIDFNSRGYKRFKLAYEQVTDNDPNTVDEFKGKYSPEFLKNLKNNYRRNRDLSIIGTVGLYLLNIVDAHVDAHLKDYDISDDLTMTLEPAMNSFYTMNTGNCNTLGFSFNIRF